MNQKSSQGNASLWVWIPLGLALGLFVAFILFLDGKKQEPESVAKVEQKQPSAERAKPVFDFYTVLPNRVIEVESPSPDAEVLSNEPEKKQAFQKYILQVGSFNNFADADEMKAQLAFLGLEAKLTNAEINNSTWYRVQLGPFESSNGLSKTKNLLIQNKIKYLQKNAS